MPNKNNTTQTPDTTPEEKPEFNLFGMSNTSSLTFLNPYQAQEEKFSIVDGFSAASVDGFNGKGEKGKENPILKHNLGAKLDNVGQSLFVTNRFSSVKKISFSDPKDNNINHVLFFDHRREKPLGYFTEKSIKDAKGNTVSVETTAQAQSLPVVIKPSTITDDELKGAYNTIVLSIKNLNMSAGFMEEVQKMPRIEKNEDLAAFIALFDRYFEPTEDNIKALKASIPDLPDNVIAPKISDFKDGISKKYNLLELIGIKIRSLKSAESIRDILVGKMDKKIADKQAHPVFSEVKDFFEKMEKMYLNIHVEEDTTVGIDATGSIVVLENSNIPKKSGGDLIKTELQKDIKPMRDEFNIIKNKAKAGEAGAKQDYVPDDNAVIKAEQTLRNKALSLGEQLGEEGAAIVQIVNSMPSISAALISRESEEKVRQALMNAANLFGFIETAIVKIFVKTSALTKDNMLTRGADRIKQQFYSSHKKDHPLARWEGVTLESANTISVIAKLPILSFPPRGKDERGVANFKELATSVFDIYVDKKDGRVVGIESRNDISYWNKSHAKLGKLLNAILNLDPADEKVETKLKNFVNFGGKIGDKNTDFGLLAMKKEETPMSHAFGDLFQEMRGMVYSGEDLDISKLEDLQLRIAGLSGSEDRNEKQLGLYVESVGRNKERNRLLEQSFYVAASTANSKKLVAYLNGVENSLSGTDAYPVKAIKDTALMVAKTIHELAPAVANGDKVREVAHRIGMNIESSQRLKLFGESMDSSTNEKVKFIQRPNTASSKKILQAVVFAEGKSEFKPEVVGALGVVESLDIVEGLKANSLEYQENKPKYDYSATALEAITGGAEQKAISSDIIQLDMSNMAALGVNFEMPKQDTNEANELPRQEELEELSPEEQEEVISSTEQKEILLDIPPIDLDDLHIALQQHKETEREDISVSAKSIAKGNSGQKQVQAPVINLFKN